MDKFKKKTLILSVIAFIMLLSFVSAGTITDCGLIGSPGTYYLQNDFGFGDECLYIWADGVVIDGNGFTLTGNVSGDGNAVNINGYDFNIQNATINGAISSNGATTTTTGGNGGNIAITNSTVGTVSVSGGAGTGFELGDGGNAGNIFITNSTTGAMNADGGDSGGDGMIGGNGGTIIIQLPSTYGALSVVGGVGGTLGLDGTIGTTTILPAALTPSSTTGCGTLTWTAGILSILLIATTLLKLLNGGYDKTTLNLIIMTIIAVAILIYFSTGVCAI